MNFKFEVIRTNNNNILVNKQYFDKEQALNEANRIYGIDIENVSVRDGRVKFRTAEYSCWVIVVK